MYRKIALQRLFDEPIKTISEKIYISLYKNYKRVVRNDLLSAINKQLLFEREQLLFLPEKYPFENNPN